MKSVMTSFLTQRSSQHSGLSSRNSEDRKQHPHVFYYRFQAPGEIEHRSPHLIRGWPANIPHHGCLGAHASTQSLSLSS